MAACDLVAGGAGCAAGLLQADTPSEIARSVFRTVIFIRKLLYHVGDVGRQDGHSELKQDVT